MNDMIQNCSLQKFKQGSIVDRVKDTKKQKGGSNSCYAVLCIWCMYVFFQCMLLEGSFEMLQVMLSVFYILSKFF